MPTQKQIEGLNFKYDAEGILKCLWAIKNGSKEHRSKACGPNQLELLPPFPLPEQFQ